MKVKCRWVPKYMQYMTEDFTILKNEEYDLLEEIDEGDGYFKIQKDNGRILTLSKRYFTEDEPKTVYKKIIWSDYKISKDGSLETTDENEFKEQLFNRLENQNEDDDDL